MNRTQATPSCGAARVVVVSSLSSAHVGCKGISGDRHTDFRLMVEPEYSTFCGSNRPASAGRLASAWNRPRSSVLGYVVVAASGRVLVLAYGWLDAIGRLRCTALGKSAATAAVAAVAAAAAAAAVAVAWCCLFTSCNRVLAAAGVWSAVACVPGSIFFFLFPLAFCSFVSFFLSFSAPF